jgi:SAM-dependent methyltransferase
MCGKDNRTQPAHALSPSDWRLVGCSDCGFVYLEDPPGYQEFVHEYAWEKTSRAERERRQTTEPVLDFLSQCARHFRRYVLKRNKLHVLVARYIPSGRLLDVGCGKGTQMGRWFDGRYQPFGVEISHALAQAADALFAQNGGRCVHNDAVSGLGEYAPDFFDGIIMKSYLEHEVAPREVCHAASRCLKPGGHLVIKVPNYVSINRRVRGRRWCGFRHPDHVNYFTPESLQKLVREAGLEVVRFNALDRITTSDNMWMVARKP